MSTPHRVHNFAPGPAVLPQEVLEQAQREMLAYKDTGVSVFELSHRSKAFDEIIHGAEKKCRQILNIPDNYKVLFLQGGATGQFAGVPLNLMGSDNTAKADFLITGTWSTKAMKEAKKYGDINIVASGEDTGFTTIPDKASWKFDDNASFVHYCANETIHGVEFKDTPDVPTNVPLVADMCSNLMSKPVDVAKHGVIYAGAQKNIAPSGLTIVIVRDDLIGNATNRHTPAVFDYKVQSDAGSRSNTPPTYSIYMADLVFDWILKRGGLDKIAAETQAKADRVYQAIDDSALFTAPVVKEYRSNMNIVFRTNESDDAKRAALETKFFNESAAKDLVSLKGHRSVGGFRASLYTAQTDAAADALAGFIREFEA